MAFNSCYYGHNRLSVSFAGESTMRRPVLLALLPLALVAFASGGAAQYAPKVGQRHPDFTFAAITTGKPVSLSDYRGKKVLLIQFASW